MGDSTVLWYPPAGDALDVLPASGYTVSYVKAGFNTTSPFGEGVGFLDNVLSRIDSLYGRDYSAYFGTQDLAAVTFYGPAFTWPDADDHPENQPWILFWRDLDAAIAASPWPGMGTEKLADDFWGQSFTGGPTGIDHHLSAVGLYGQNEAAVDGLAVEQHRAGAALALGADFLRASQTQLVAEEVQ